MLYLKNQHQFFKHLIVGPLVLSVIIPLLIMDIWTEIYHRICFPLMRVPYVKRKDYIKIVDRAKLSYLNVPQKFFCMYCGYGNGVIRYWAKIATETELYWCGIKHKKDRDLFPPDYQKNFADYDNENDYKNKYAVKN